MVLWSVGVRMGLRGRGSANMGASASGKSSLRIITIVASETLQEAPISIKNFSD